MSDVTTQLAKAICEGRGHAWGNGLPNEYWESHAKPALEFLTTTGHLIPAGGMALTAEQVEDVRYDGWVGADMYMAMRKVGIAEETAEAAMDYMKALGLVVRRKGVRIAPADWPNPALAEPAEEETKAECVGDDYYCAQRDSAGNIRLNCGRGLLVAEAACTVNDVKEWWIRADRGSKWERQYQAALDLFDREAASSPVVPAPTETGPWQRIEDVPESVYLIKDCEGDKWRRDRKSWEVYSERGFRWHPGFPDRFAPFVAAEEG